MGAPDGLPSRLRHVRETLGLSRSAFADRLGIPRNSVSRYELGRQTPSVAALLKIARVGGVTVDWLLAGGDGQSRMAPVGNWPATVAALAQVWTDPRQRAAVQTALEAWAKGVPLSPGDSP
jgi:transcriptional regulator with XRE-family HTH domain